MRVHISQIYRQSGKLDSLWLRTSGVNHGQDESIQFGRTSGGGALGGAIAGGAVGASYGPQGIVAGVLVGAIIGDNFEERIDNEPAAVRDTSGRAKER